jgi:hypothetical protein
MHGHPFPEPVQLWWGRGEDADRPRNLFFEPGDRPKPEDMFRAGGLIDDNGQVADREALIRLMTRLTERIRGERPPGDSPLPSGYTYLLQFIAHDMVDSVVSFSLAGDKVGFGTRNARVAPLMLDTLYGLGPEECPQAYAFTKRPPNQLSRIPRTRLCLGPMPSYPPSDRRYYQPFRDLARSSPNSLTGQERSLLCESMVADTRNDGHALISQLTVLFQLLHNHILDLIERATEPAAESDNGLRELAFRRFQCARLVTTLIYRNIITRDVLSRILDCDIYNRYMRNTDDVKVPGQDVVDAVVDRQEGKPPFDCGKGVPLEFTFGAFRFGHALIRNEYQTNSAFRQQPIKGALDLSPLRYPEKLPIGKVDKSWLVDWAYFFETDKMENGRKIEPNRAGKFAPAYADWVEDSGLFKLNTELKVGGLVNRDLVSAAHAGMISVPTLCRLAKAKGFSNVECFDAWRPRLETWLKELQTENREESDRDESDAFRVIANDPPLPFFVLFESARIGRGDEAEGGRRLGPLGSIIVAEAILGAMRRYPLGVEESHMTLKERIKTCAALFDGDLVEDVERTLSQVDEIACMPGLLRYMESQDLFPPV